MEGRAVIAGQTDRQGRAEHTGQGRAGRADQVGKIV